MEVDGDCAFDVCVMPGWVGYVSDGVGVGDVIREVRCVTEGSVRGWVQMCEGKLSRGEITVWVT